jgi:DNA-binding IclR family transcriptional regulator
MGRRPLIGRIKSRNGMNRSIQRNASQASPVLKAVALLEAVVRAGGPVSLADLSSKLALPKPTAHRLARLLEKAGLLQKNPLTRRYLVGSAFLDLGLHALMSAPANLHRRRLLERLSEKLGETVNLGILSGDVVIYLDRVEASWPLRMDFKPGSRVPFHCTANGKLLVAWARPALRERLLRSQTFPAYTPHTLVTRAALLAELSEIRRRGYSEDNEEFLAGVCCLAVPVRDRRGAVVAGLAVSAPSARFNLERARGHLSDLLAVAEELGTEFEAHQEGDGG